MTKLFDITGKAISGEWGSDDENNTGIPVIRTTNFTNEGNIDYSNVVTRSIKKKNIVNKFLKQGDIIIEKSGGSDDQPVGRVVYFNGQNNKYLFNNFTGLLRIKDTAKWNPRYVFWVLYASYKQGKTKLYQNRTTGLHNLRTDAYVKDLDIKFLPLEEQKHISEVLDKIRFQIELKEREISKLDTLIKARFVEMFGDPGSNNKEINVKKLGEVCVLNPKKNTESNLFDNLRVSFVPMSSVSEKGDMNLEQTKLYSEVKKGFTYFSDDDVLFAKITPCMENGKGAIALNLKNRIGFGSTEFHVLRPIRNISNPYWLYVLTTFTAFRKLAESNMTGSAGQRRVPVKFLENYKVAVPPIELQNEFASFVQQVDKSKVVNNLIMKYIINIGFIYSFFR